MKFNPLKYSTTESTESSNDSYQQSVNNVVNDSSNSYQEESPVEKGHKNMVKVDLDKFEDLCKKFKDKKDIKIKNLIGQDKTDFDSVVNYVQLLYGTTYYNKLYEKVKKHFKNITYKPNTVGAYFMGCADNKYKGNIMSGCSINCAGSMPLPKEEENWNFCDKAVILAEKAGKGYNFSFVKPAHSQEDLDPAYVFVESNSLKNFSGFCKEEKAHLRALGCKKVKLIGYSNSEDSLNYSEFYNEPKNVTELKHRRNQSQNFSQSENSYEENCGWHWLLWLIVIIIIILILLALYKHRK
jgi:hypothetical protein